MFCLPFLGVLCTPEPDFYFLLFSFLGQISASTKTNRATPLVSWELEEWYQGPMYKS